MSNSKIIREKLNDPLLELDNLEWKDSKPIEIVEEEEEIKERKKTNFGFLKSLDEEKEKNNIKNVVKKIQI